MNNLTPLILTSIAGFSTMLGNLLLFINLKYKDKLISFSLGLSFIVMFLISILELVPEGLSLIYGSMPNIYLFIFAFILLSIGYLIIVGIEKNIKNNDGLYRIGILSMISLLLHNIPEGISIAVPIYYSTGSKIKAIFYTFLAGLSEPIGAILTGLFLVNYVNDMILGLLFAFIAGVMIQISSSKLLPTGNEYDKGLSRVFFFVGFLVMLFSLVLTG